MINENMMQGDMMLGEAVNAVEAERERAQAAERQRRLNVLAAVWQYDEDEGARALVDGDGKYRLYGSPYMRNDDSLDMYGQDCAEVAAPDLANSPLELCERVIKGMPEEKRKGYQEAYNALFASGKDTKRDWYALYGRMMRDGVLEGVAERKRAEEEQRRERAMIDGFGDMVGDLVRGKKAVGDLSPEWLELLQRGGVSLGDLEVAGQAYSMVGDKGADEMNYYDAVKTLRGNEKSRNLLLSVIAEDAMREQKDRSSGSVVRQAGEAVLSFGKDVYRFGADVVQKGLLGNSRNQRSMLAAFRTGVSSDEKDALIGAVNGARDEGVQMEKEGRGFKMIDMFDSIGSFGSMALKFANPGTAALEAANMYESNKNSMLNSSRTYEVTDEMYEEWVQELVRGGMSVEEALEEAEKMKAEAEREVDPLKVSGKAALYAGIEYASMKAGLGAVRRVAGRFVPSLYRGMTKATRGVAASRYGIGAFGLGVGATMFDLGVAMPAVSGAGKLAVDQIPGLDDAKISTGKDELAAWWDNVGKMRYWGEQLGAGLLGGAMGARGRMLGARAHLGERRAAVIDGLSGEQYDKIMHLEPGKRFAEWDRIVRENKEKDFEETTRRSIKAYEDAVNHELARQKRADEATRAALQMYGMDFAPGEKPGEVVMYYGGRSEGGKFVRGEKKMVMTEEEADVYVGGVMRSRLEKTVKVLKNAAGNERLLDAFKELPGEVDIEWMRSGEDMRGAVARGERAAERVEELVKGGKSRKAAEGEVHADIDGERTLGEVVNFGQQAAERVKVAKARGEAADVTRANVTLWHDADGRTVRRVLRIANGASVREAQEELAEQVALDYMESNGMSPVTAYRYLSAMRDWMRKQEDAPTKEAAEAFINLEQTHPELARRILREDFDAEDVNALTLDEQRALERAVVEGVSRLMFSDRYTKALSHDDAPAAWANELMQDALTYAADLPREVAMAKALEVAQKEGWMPEAAKKLLGVGSDAVEAALARDGAPTAEEYSRAWMEQQRRQAELDAAYGRGRVHDPAETDAFEERAKAGQAEVEERRARRAEEEQAEGKTVIDELAAAPENAGKSREEVAREAADRLHDAREEELGLDPTAQEDAAFSGGACVEVTDERGLVCKSGVVEVAKLKLMPQFKLGADKESGVVHELKGDYFADHDPIRIYRDEKGELVVFSGRHRLDAAKRAGVKRIVAYVYEGKSEEWARLYDIELNIRDNQATALEVAMYVRGEFTGGEALTEEQVASVGIAREGKLGAIGLRIGRNAGESVMDALRNGKIEDSEALAIADFAPGNENVQRKGLAILMEGGSKTEARERMVAELELAKMAKELGIEQGEDLFGNTMDNDAWLDFVAKYVVRRRNEITKDIQYLRTTATRKNAKAMAEKYGVDVKDPDGMKKALREAESLRDRWKSPYTDAELMEEIKGVYRAEYPGEEAASQSERIMADYSRYLGERESVTHFSVVAHDLYKELYSAFRKVPNKGGGKVWARKTKAGTVFRVCQYPDVLNRIAPWNGNVITRAEVARKLLNKHHFSMHDVARLPHALWDPIAVFEESSNSLIVITDIRTRNEKGENKNALAVLELRVDGENAEITDVKTAYAADSLNKYKNLFEGKALRYVDKARAQQWAKEEGSSIFQLLTTSLAEPDSEVMLKENMPDVNYNFPGGDRKNMPDSLVTHFSVIGERAATWDKYKDRAFKGRDDGKMRAELDASKATLKKGALKKFNEYLAGWKDVCTIGDLLSFPELFEAYPWLKDRTVHRPHGRRSSARMSSKGVMNDYINLGTKADDKATLASLLHEVQHLIQHYEGFSAGAGSNYGVEEIWREIGREDELPNWSDERYESMYWRQAGETEARNVQQRLYMTARDRRNKPFNETLDVPSEDVMKFTLDEYFAAQYAKRAAEQGGVTHFSVAGMRARTAGANMEASYVDPADGKRKFVIPVNGARLSTGFTPGQLNAPLGGHKDVSLAALLHYPALYQAYPWLAEMRVRLYNPTEKQDRRQGAMGAYGYFCPPREGEAAYIAINSRLIKEKEGGILNTLLHEAQHAIQHYEGHASGAGFHSTEAALEYIDRAIKQREANGVEDDWAKDNLAYLMAMRRMVEAGGEDVLYWAYLHSHGEQEARYTGEQKEGEPLAGDGSGLTTEGEESFATIAVNSEAKELGGVTFGGLSRFDYLLESRLAPGGEFNYDRAVYQMRDAIKRRAAELEMLGKEHDGAKLVAEAMAVMESVEGLLPNEYRYGLEAYKVYLSSYAKLYESGSPRVAGDMVPMEGWDKRMEGAYHNIAVRMLMGRMRADEMEFWAHRKDTLEKLEGEQGNFQALVEEKAEKLRAQGFSRSERKVQREAVTQAWGEYLMEHGDFVHDVMQGIGEVRTDKLVAKFLERAAMQLDAYRKDKTLGKIRRVVDRLTPLPGKDGKPVKGQLDAERYRKVVDFVRLMELTRGQRELFERERYTGEGTEKAWGELEANDLITVPTYDADGKKLEITCTKQEFETYASFETMSAAQAEAAARALGEYVTTGRQAWENAQEAQRARIEELCAPAMKLYSETENELHEREGKQQRKVGPLVRKMLNWTGFFMNDAQFMDAVSSIPGIEKWTQDAVYRIGKAHAYIEMKEKERHEDMVRLVREVSGAKSTEEANAWLDGVHEVRDSGVELVEQEPDFAGQEQEAVRLQFMGLLRRKVKQKNFRPDTFAAALRYWADSPDLFGEYMPKGVLEEAMAKYGTIGDADASRYQGIDALNALMTPRELERFADLNKTAKVRAEAAREKWLAERKKEGEEEKPKIENLRLTRAQAAYRVLLAEQADYTETLRQQGYTPEVVERLKAFAGDDVMRLAYALREKMGERTAEIKEMYERVYGMPFPEVDNYFRAFFNAGYDVQRQGAMDGQGTGHAAGGSIKILYHRNHRNAKIERAMDVLSAFAAGMKEQDLLLGYGELPSELARIINFRKDGKSMQDVLSRAMGAAAYGELRAHVEHMTQLLPEVETNALHLTRGVNALSGSAANMILNFRMGSLVKQLTGIFNAVNGSDVVTVSEYLASLAHLRKGRAKISLKELAARPELAGRFKGWDFSAESEALRRPQDVKVGINGRIGKAARVLRRGMSAMEWLDVKANVVSSAALYDAVYRRVTKDGKLSHEEADGLAMEEVRKALALKSQPLDARQRALSAWGRSVYKAGFFFLGGESVNTFARCASLAARGNKWKAAEVWLAHGAMLQVLTLAYNWLTDDKEQWEKRKAGWYLANVVLGPLGGIPILSTVAEDAVAAPLRKMGVDVPYIQTSELAPYINVRQVIRDVDKVFKKKSSWQDKTIAANNVLRSSLIAAATMNHSPTSKGGAAAKAAMYALGGVSNMLDFLLRTERAVEERALGK